MHRQYISILGEIFQIIADSDNPEDTLNRIVALVAQRFSADVCSVYVYQPIDHRLVLKATVGLNWLPISSVFTRKGNVVSPPLIWPS